MELQSVNSFYKCKMVASNMAAIKLKMAISINMAISISTQHRKGVLGLWLNKSIRIS